MGAGGKRGGGWGGWGGEDGGGLRGIGGGMTSEVGKHPDLLVGPPTSPVFPTNDRKYKKSQFFEKI